MFLSTTNLSSAQTFRSAHRGKICVHVFIWVSVYTCCERLRCIVILKKREGTAPELPDLSGAQSFGDAHRVRIYILKFIWVSVYL
jgi:hypothetical protein